MIEIIFLVAALAAFHETARRRGVAAWPFIAIAVIGFLVFGNLAAAFLGAGPHFFVSWGWLGLTYLSIYIIGGGGRMLKDTWQCPECRLFNSPSTIVCPCGYEPSPDS
ncbi:MAG: zinc finger Ran-binding domain-containing protein [Holophagales bacterium]|nr:zinc finger Ran-binding domain-containing protein [Holophagales bacterium]